LSAAIGILGGVGFEKGAGGGVDLGTGVAFEADGSNVVGVGVDLCCDGAVDLEVITGFEGGEVFGGIFVEVAGFETILDAAAGFTSVRGFDGAGDESDAVGLYDVVFVLSASNADIEDNSRTRARILEFSGVIGGSPLDCASSVEGNSDFDMACVDDLVFVAVTSIFDFDFVVIQSSSTGDASLRIFGVFATFNLAGVFVVVAAFAVFLTVGFLAAAVLSVSNPSLTTFFGLPLFFATSVDDISTLGARITFRRF
jgi:hypothetical protein